MFWLFCGCFFLEHHVNRVLYFVLLVVRSEPEFWIHSGGQAYAARLSDTLTLHFASYVLHTAAIHVTSSYLSYIFHVLMLHKNVPERNVILCIILVTSAFGLECL
jgi:hypothetical protein